MSRAPTLPKPARPPVWPLYALPYPRSAVPSAAIPDGLSLRDRRVLQNIADMKPEGAYRALAAAPAIRALAAKALILFTPDDDTRSGTARITKTGRRLLNSYVPVRRCKPPP